MEYLFDTANLEDIRTYGAIYPYTGVTTNPSIIKKEGKINFFEHCREIRRIISDDRTLHIQVTALKAEDMVKEADAILDKIDGEVFIKVPVTEEGLKAIRALKKKDIGVTATAVYTKAQGFLAMEAGADYIAAYFNRMENMDINASSVIGSMAQMIRMWDYKTQILAASFKNMAQVNAAFEAGAHTATVQPDILKTAVNMAAIGKAAEDFAKDWRSVFGDVKIYEME